ncbi:hypothetical protein [Nonomuraea sp. bgisy101]|uniref:hypothetical protein n=1 Tax=Nonomuraea sp. bgisy101 TaxID=3413784 RepID=UPI003D71A94E
MPSSGGTPGTTDQLSRYIRDYLAEHDESERALARRAIDPETGFTLQHGWINQLAQNRVARAPELWRLRALAAAVQKPARMLAELAAAQWLGVEVAEVPQAGGDDWVAVTVPPDMTPEERERFVLFAQDIVRRSTK